MRLIQKYLGIKNNVCFINLFLLIMLFTVKEYLLGKWYLRNKKSKRTTETLGFIKQISIIFKWISSMFFPTYEISTTSYYILEWNRFPIEILTLIFSHLSVESRDRVKLVCKRWK